MQLPMMAAAKRYREFIADLHSQRSGLGKTQVMRIGRLSPADETRLRLLKRRGLAAHWLRWHHHQVSTNIPLGALNKGCSGLGVFQYAHLSKLISFISFIGFVVIVGRAARKKYA
jgi:hypothetical protein